MQSRNLLNIFLLLAVTGLSVTIWFISQKKPDVRHVSTLDAAQVSRIVIPRAQSEIVITRQGNNWNMEKPYALPAHEFRVQSLLELLQTPVNQSYAAGELDLAQFGLNPARATIRFNEQEIHFGKTNPVNNKRYILSENNIYLLNDTLYPLVSAEAASLISLSPLPSNVAIEKIILPDLILQKTTENAWQDTHGKVIAADTAQQFLEDWRNASAFAAHAYMPRAGAKQVTIESANKLTLQFLVIPEADWLIIGRPDAGIEYHLDLQYRDKLLSLPAAAAKPDQPKIAAP